MLIFSREYHFSTFKMTKKNDVFIIKLNHRYTVAE